MIDESLKFAGVAPGTKLRTAVDVGCGIGGSSRHIVSARPAGSITDRGLSESSEAP